MLFACLLRVFCVASWLHTPFYILLLQCKSKPVQTLQYPPAPELALWPVSFPGRPFNGPVSDAPPGKAKGSRGRCLVLVQQPRLSGMSWSISSPPAALPAPAVTAGPGNRMVGGVAQFARGTAVQGITAQSVIGIGGASFRGKSCCRTIGTHVGVSGMQTKAAPTRLLLCRAYAALKQTVVADQKG